MCLRGVKKGVKKGPFFGFFRGQKTAKNAYESNAIFRQKKVKTLTHDRGFWSKSVIFSVFVILSVFDHFCQNREVPEFYRALTQDFDPWDDETPVLTGFSKMTKSEKSAFLGVSKKTGVLTKMTQNDPNLALF